MTVVVLTLKILDGCLAGWRAIQSWKYLPNVIPGGGREGMRVGQPPFTGVDCGLF